VGRIISELIEIVERPKKQDIGFLAPEVKCVPSMGTMLAYQLYPQNPLFPLLGPMLGP
jgi:hypothetical protein